MCQTQSTTQHYAMQILPNYSKSTLGIDAAYCCRRAPIPPGPHVLGCGFYIGQYCTQAHICSPNYHTPYFPAPPTLLSHAYTFPHRVHRSFPQRAYSSFASRHSTFHSYPAHSATQTRAHCPRRGSALDAWPHSPNIISTYVTVRPGHCGSHNPFSGIQMCVASPSIAAL